MNQPWTYKCVFPIEPFSCLPFYLSCQRALGLSSLHHTASFHWLSFTYGKACFNDTLSSSHSPLPPLCPQVCSLCLCLHAPQFSPSVISDSFNPMDCRMPGFPVHHQLLELAQTHLHQVGDTIQLFHSLLSPSPPALNPSQHQDLFQ